MNFNKDIVQGRWNEIKGQVKKTWGKLTDDEIEQTKGDLTALGGLIQRRYGEAKEDYRRKMDDIVKNFASDDATPDDVDTH